MDNLIDFCGKLAIVKRSGRGIGRKAALMFASGDAMVLVNDIGIGSNGDRQDKSIAEATAQEIRDARSSEHRNIFMNDIGMPRRMEGVAAVIGWLCSDILAALNGHEIFVSGSQIALVQEPELGRSEFTATGWTVEQLGASGVIRALTRGEYNRLTGVE